MSAALLTTDRPITQVREEHAAWLQERKSQFLAALTRDTQPRRRKGLGEAVMGAMMGGGFGYGWPGAWSQDRIEQILHFKHWTYIALGSICKKVAGLAPNVAEVYSDGAAAHSGYNDLVRRHRFHRSLKSIQPHEQIQPVGDNHPLKKLFHNPNEPDVAWDLWYELVLFLGLTGNSYLWCVPSRLGRLDGTGKPCELWVIPSHWVWPRLGKRNLVDYYEVRPWIGPGMFKFPADEIIHFRWKSPMHKVDGHSPQTAGSEWIDASESVNRTRFWQFKNFCAPFGAIELHEQFHDPDDQDLDRIYAKFFARAQGERNYGRPIVLPPGAKFVPLAIAPDKMAYAESFDQLRDAILALFGVPKEIAGIQDAGSEIAMYGPMQQFCELTINPILQYLSQVLTEKLAHRFDKRLRIWWDDPTPNNPTQLNADIKTDYECKAILPNEIRAIRGRAPYAHGGNDPIALMGESPLPLNTGEDPIDLAMSAVAANRLTDSGSSGTGAVPGLDAGGLADDRLQLSAPVHQPANRLRRQLLAHRKDLVADFPDVRQTEAYDCGAAALFGVCKFFGVGPATEDELMELLGTDPQDGTAPASIEEIAAGLGLDVRAGVMDLDELKADTAAGKPVICCIQRGGTGTSQDANKEGHYVVALQVTDKSVIVQDPVDGRRRIGKKLWLERWHDQDADGNEYQQYGITIGPAKGKRLTVGRGAGAKHVPAWW